MDTSGETPLSISREVLLQVQRDGRTYTELAKRMATVILNNMKEEGIPSEFEAILVRQGDDQVFKEQTKRAKELGCFLLRFEPLSGYSHYRFHVVDLGE